MLFFLLGAALTDRMQHRIFNWWVLIGAAAGIYLRGADFLAAFAGILFVLLPLFRIRAFGAGDVKLMALICGYAGVFEGVKCIYAGMVFAAAVSVCRMIQTKSLKARLIHLCVYIRHTIQTKQITEYCDIRREKSGAVIALAPYLFLGTVIVLLAGI